MTTEPQILDRKEHPHLQTKVQVGQRCTVNMTRTVILDNRPDDGTDTPAKYENLFPGEVGIFLGNIALKNWNWRYFEIAVFPSLGRVILTDGLLEPVNE